MKSYYTEITQEDLDNYFTTLSNKGVIRQKLKHIYRSMPLDLKIEFAKLQNNLVCTNYSENIYQIVTERASEELQNYLKQFTFKLVNDKVHV
jgi:hypothetical protein